MTGTGTVFAARLKVLLVTAIPLAASIAGILVVQSRPFPSWQQRQDEEAKRVGRTLRRADAIEDANGAIGKGDYRFVGISGYAPIVPVPDSFRFSWNRCDYRIVEFTSDVVTDSVALLNDLAFAYASRYNAQLVSRVPAELLCPAAQEAGEPAAIQVEIPDDCLIHYKPIARQASYELNLNYIVRTDANGVVLTIESKNNPGMEKASVLIRFDLLKVGLKGWRIRPQGRYRITISDKGFAPRASVRLIRTGDLGTGVSRLVAPLPVCADERAK